MADEILIQMFNTIGGDVIGSSMAFGLFVVLLLIILLVFLRLPFNITFAFIFPVIIAFTIFGYFPPHIKAIASLIEGVIWFFIMRSLIFNE